MVAGRVREARKRRGWQLADLAARCAELGHPELTENVIENIEGGRRDSNGRRRRAVTVDELRVLSDALGFSPADVLNGLPPGTLGGMTVDQLENVATALQGAASFLRFREETAAAQPAVVAAIVTSQHGVLVGRRRDGKPPWTFIAGEQDAVKDENPADTAVREVKEETGLRVVVGDVIGERIHPGTLRRIVYLSARPTHGTDIFVGDEEELAEVRWVGLAELDELMGRTVYGPVREHLARELGDR